MSGASSEGSSDSSLVVFLNIVPDKPHESMAGLLLMFPPLTQAYSTAFYTGSFSSQ